MASTRYFAIKCMFGSRFCFEYPAEGTVGGLVRALQRAIRRDCNISLVMDGQRWPSFFPLAGIEVGATVTAIPSDEIPICLGGEPPSWDQVGEDGPPYTDDEGAEQEAADPASEADSPDEEEEEAAPGAPDDGGDADAADAAGGASRVAGGSGSARAGECSSRSAAGAECSESSAYDGSYRPRYSSARPSRATASATDALARALSDRERARAAVAEARAGETAARAAAAEARAAEAEARAVEYQVRALAMHAEARAQARAQARGDRSSNGSSSSTTCGEGHNESASHIPVLLQAADGSRFSANARPGIRMVDIKRYMERNGHLALPAECVRVLCKGGKPAQDSDTVQSLELQPGSLLTFEAIELGPTARARPQGRAGSASEESKQEEEEAEAKEREDRWRGGAGPSVPPVPYVQLARKARVKLIHE